MTMTRADIRRAMHRIWARQRAYAPWAVLVGVVLLLTLLLCVFLWPDGADVRASDLVSAHVDDTTYLRPKQWQPASVGTTGAYGVRGASGKFTEVVTVEQTDSIGGVGNLSATAVNSIRDQVIAKTWPSSISDGGSRCQSVENFTKQADTAHIGDTTGIVRVEGTCVNPGGSYRIVMRTVVGTDGYGRTISIIASPEVWQRDAKAFELMLASVHQEN